jgi:hypothetical protein
MYQLWSSTAQRRWETARNRASKKSELDAPEAECRIT